jgi:hypothetical protein
VPSALKLPGSREWRCVGAVGHVAAGILDKKKVGLEMPYSFWLRTELKIWSTLPGRERIRRQASNRVPSNNPVNEHQTARVDHGRAVGVAEHMCGWAVIAEKL